MMERTAIPYRGVYLHDLPSEDANQWVLALMAKTGWTYDPCKYSVSELISPPRIVALMRSRWEEIEIPLSSCWALAIGTALHASWEAHATGDVEQGLGIEREVNCVTYRITGRADRIVGTKVSDWKSGNAWQVIGGPKPDHVRQVQLYAHLATEMGREITEAELDYRFSTHDAGKGAREADYPTQANVVYPVSLWSWDEREDYMMGRLHDLIAACAGQSRDCTDEERWMQYVRVVKDGKARAVRRLPTMEEAKEWIAVQTDRKGLRAEPGEYRRCADYCPIRSICPQAKGV